jgi:hypothetical protein
VLHEARSHRTPSRHINRDERLVEQQQIRNRSNCSRKTRTLALATGHFVRAATCEFTDFELGKQGFSALTRLDSANSAEPQRRGNVVAERHGREQRGALWKIADTPWQWPMAYD